MLRLSFLYLVVFSIAKFLPGIVVDSEAFVAAAPLTRDDRTKEDTSWFCVPEPIGENDIVTENDPIEEESFRCSVSNHPIPPTVATATAAADFGQSEQAITTTPTPPTESTAANSLHGRLLCASQCAYLSAADLRAGSSYFRGAGFLAGTSVKRIGPRSGLDACLVGRTLDGIVVAFRGTSGAPLEWLQNARINLKPIPKNLVPAPAPTGAKIHAGFSGILRGRFGRGIKTAILELLAETTADDETTTKIYVTGHSKGGSLATLFALMMHHDRDLESPELVCTFGAARVGNAAFGKYYDGLVNQVTYENDLDIVPFLPPGQKIMEDIENGTDDPEAMMEMLDEILEPAAAGKNRTQRRKREPWYYNPIGKRTYIDTSGNLLHPVPRDLDTQRIKDLEGKNLRDLRRAHCSSCSIEEEEDDLDESNGSRGSSKSSSTCSGGYFAALAPEICERASVSAA